MNKEINEIIDNLEQTLGWCDRITTGNLPHKIANLKQCLVSTIELLKVLNLGWHPASELPPVDENGNSGELIAITHDNNLMKVYFHYESKEYNFWVESDDWNKQVQYGVNVKRWCYPPKED